MKNSVNGKPRAIRTGLGISSFLQLFFDQDLVDHGLLGEVDSESIITGSTPFIIYSKVPRNGSHEVDVDVLLEHAFKPSLS